MCEGDSGDAAKGDTHVQALIDEHVMKEWMQDGIRMCGYREVEVTKEEGMNMSSTTNKACVFCLPGLYRSNTSLYNRSFVICPL